MKEYLRILKHAKAYLQYVVLNIVFNAFYVIFSLVSLVLIIPFLELLFDKKPPVSEAPEFSFSVDAIIDMFYFRMGSYMEAHGKEETLIWFCFLIVAIFFLKNLFRYAALYCMAAVRNGVVFDLRKELYDTILALPLSYFSKERKGDLISRMNADVNEIEKSIMSTLEVAFKEPFTIIVYLITMLFMSPQLTIFVLIMIGLTGILIGQVGRSLKKKSGIGQQKLGILTSILDETIGGLRIIKSFNAGSNLRNKFEDTNRSYLSISNQVLRRRDLSSPLSEVLTIIIVAIVLWFGGGLVLDETNPLQAETFIGFMLIFSQLIPPAKKFATAFYNIQRGLASSERVSDVMDTPIEVVKNTSTVSFENFRSGISYENVSFSYVDGEEVEVLSDVSFYLPKGKMFALVGQSGSGKSTLVDLLPRFYEPRSGKILIDDIDIRQIDLNQLRSMIGVVSQDPILFNDTIYNNILMGNESASRADVEKAARVANAHNFIMSSQNGYETTIGDRGMNLSGGERQRLTIARAVLKNPSILILDEATSSLDSESEKLVQDALLKLMKNRTSIVIAHRLSTIQFADEILVMDNGRIVERGSHQDLLSSNGVYNRLVELQQF
ncbi:MAG: ABC transporter ATP-binding protein [Chitinophagales bacterium]|nr:ABC transporter ATP-binding protein [Chitinophagales bacterium]